MNRRILAACAMAVAIMTTGAVRAQNPVPSLQDLVGVKASGAETTLKSRGYTWVRTAKSGSDSYTYWQENENGQCIVVRTTDGRYASIVYAPAGDCKAEKSAAPAPGSDEFQTVGGVYVDGKWNRYLCTVHEVVKNGKTAETILRFPDQTIRLAWKPNKRVAVTFEGMKPKELTYASAEGEINFIFEGKTYYYISSREMAKKEVQNFGK